MANLPERWLVLSNQIGQVALDIQKIMVQPDSVSHISLEQQEEQLTQDYQDLVTQVCVLGKELGLIKDSADLGAILARGEERMERRRQEYKAKGWRWL